MDDEETLQSSLDNHKLQLQAVNAALTTSKSKELASLQRSLLQVIRLTEESLLSEKKKKLLLKVESIEVKKEKRSAHDEEFDRFQAEINFLTPKTELVDKQKRKFETNKETEDSVSRLIGRKCQAPYLQRSGELAYHNAVILNVDIINSKNLENADITVLFTNPRTTRMKPCPAFMKGECKLKSGLCKLSHGYIVKLSSLQEYKEPDYSLLKKHALCLAKHYSEVWQPAVVLQVMSKHMVRVNFTGTNRKSFMANENVLPLEPKPSKPGNFPLYCDILQNVKVEDYIPNVGKTAEPLPPNCMGPPTITRMPVGRIEAQAKGILKKGIQKTNPIPPSNISPIQPARETFLHPGSIQPARATHGQPVKATPFKSPNVIPIQPAKGTFGQPSKVTYPISPSKVAYPIQPVKVAYPPLQTGRPNPFQPSTTSLPLPRPSFIQPARPSFTQPTRPNFTQPTRPNLSLSTTANSVQPTKASTAIQPARATTVEPARSNLIEVPRENFIQPQIEKPTQTPKLIETQTTLLAAKSRWEAAETSISSQGKLSREVKMERRNKDFMSRNILKDEQKLLENQIVAAYEQMPNQQTKSEKRGPNPADRPHLNEKQKFLAEQIASAYKQMPSEEKRTVFEFLKSQLDPKPNDVSPEDSSYDIPILDETRIYPRTTLEVKGLLDLPGKVWFGNKRCDIQVKMHQQFHLPILTSAALKLVEPTAKIHDPWREAEESLKLSKQLALFSQSFEILGDAHVHISTADLSVDIPFCVIIHNQILAVLDPMTKGLLFPVQPSVPALSFEHSKKVTPKVVFRPTLNLFTPTTSTEIPAVAPPPNNFHCDTIIKNSSVGTSDPKKCDDQFYNKSSSVLLSDHNPKALSDSSKTKVSSSVIQNMPKQVKGRDLKRGKSVESVSLKINEHMEDFPPVKKLNQELLSECESLDHIKGLESTFARPKNYFEIFHNVTKANRSVASEYKLKDFPKVKHRVGSNPDHEYPVYPKAKRHGNCDPEFVHFDTKPKVGREYQDVPKLKNRNISDHEYHVPKQMRRGDPDNVYHDVFNLRNQSDRDRVYHDFPEIKHKVTDHKYIDAPKLKRRDDSDYEYQDVPDQKHSGHLDYKYRDKLEPKDDIDDEYRDELEHYRGDSYQEYHDFPKLKLKAEPDHVYHDVSYLKHRSDSEDEYSDIPKSNYRDDFDRESHVPKLKRRGDTDYVYRDVLKPKHRVRSEHVHQDVPKPKWRDDPDKVYIDVLNPKHQDDAYYDGLKQRSRVDSDFSYHDDPRLKRRVHSEHEYEFSTPKQNSLENDYGSGSDHETESFRKDKYRMSPDILKHSYENYSSDENEVSLKYENYRDDSDHEYHDAAHSRYIYKSSSSDADDNEIKHRYQDVPSTNYPEGKERRHYDSGDSYHRSSKPKYRIHSDDDDEVGRYRSVSREKHVSSSGNEGHSRVKHQYKDNPVHGPSGSEKYKHRHFSRGQMKGDFEYRSSSATRSRKLSGDEVNNPEGFMNEGASDMELLASTSNVFPFNPKFQRQFRPFFRNRSGFRRRFRGRFKFHPNFRFQGQAFFPHQDPHQVQPGGFPPLGPPFQAPLGLKSAYATHKKVKIQPGGFPPIGPPVQAPLGLKPTYATSTKVKGGFEPDKTLNPLEKNEETQDTSSNTPSTSSQQGKCFRCGSYTHKASNCLKPRNLQPSEEIKSDP